MTPQEIEELQEIPMRNTHSQIGNYKINLNMKTVNGSPRRAQLQHMTKEERAIWDAHQMIENMPHAHPLITECQVLLDKAKDKLSDWVDMQIGDKG